MLCYLHALSEVAVPFLFLPLTPAVPAAKRCTLTLCARYAKLKMSSVQAGRMAKSCIDPAGLPNCQSGSPALPVKGPVARRALTRNNK